MLMASNCGYAFFLVLALFGIRSPNYGAGMYGTGASPRAPPCPDGDQ